MNSQFIIKQLTNEQSEIYDRLIKDGYGKLTAKALALRNFSMSDKLIHYSLLHDIDKAVDYLFQYLLEEKPICIVADYDVRSNIMFDYDQRFKNVGKSRKNKLFCS